MTPPAARAKAHATALYVARWAALRFANDVAGTEFAKPEEGADNPIFRNAYVATFVSAYHSKIEELRATQKGRRYYE